jgi:hypothetical protein
VWFYDLLLSNHKNVKMREIFFTILCSSIINLNAQETIDASGGNASGSGGSVSYSVGQLTYNTYSLTAGNVSQGVQQAFEISVVTELNESSIDLQLSSYPNPTSDVIILQNSKQTTKDLSYQLFDVQGKLLVTESINQWPHAINMQNLVPGTYFLKVSNTTTQLKTFQIIKN